MLILLKRKVFHQHHTLSHMNVILVSLWSYTLTFTSLIEYRILTREPNADPSAYPRTRLYESGAYRQFQPTWLKSYPWLHYSDHSDGAFCCACVFFPPDKVGGQCPGFFVTKPGP